MGDKEDSVASSDKDLQKQQEETAKVVVKTLPNTEKNNLVEEAVREAAKAVKSGNVAMLQSILDTLSKTEKIALLNKTIGNWNDTFITFSILHDYPEILETLLAVFPENERDTELQSHLQQALWDIFNENKPAKFRALLDECSFETISIVMKRILDTHGQSKALTWALRNNMSEIIEITLNFLSDTDKNNLILEALNQIASENENTILKQALDSENIEIVEVALNSLSDFEKNQSINEAVTEAINQYNFERLKLILEALSAKEIIELIQKEDPNSKIANALRDAWEEVWVNKTPVDLSLQDGPTQSNEFNAFLLRIERQKIRPMGKELDQLLSKTALVKILDYFLMNQDEELKTLLPDSKQKEIQRNLNVIAALKPGQTYRLAKERTGLPRTVNILCAADGELQLIVETKSKLSDDTKQKLPIKKGTYKTGKPAWRIDSEEAQLFNLVTRPRNESNVRSVEEEIRISQEMSSESVLTYQKGADFIDKKNKRKISIYAPIAEVDLHNLLNSEYYSLSHSQKDSLILDLLKGVKRFHDNGRVHQDLKPKNALVYGNATEGYHLKLIDFGLAAEQGDSKKELSGTATHVSPEIAYYFSAPNSSQYSYFNSGTCRATLGYQVYKDKENAKLFPTDGSERNKMAAPDSANDMWALGIVIFQIQHKGRLPTMQDLPEIQADPLLKGLLNPDRTQRINIDTALQIHQAEIVQTPQATPLTFSAEGTTAFSSAQAATHKKSISPPSAPPRSEDTPGL